MCVIRESLFVSMYACIYFLFCHFIKERKKEKNMAPDVGFHAHIWILYRMIWVDDSGGPHQYFFQGPIIP